MREYEEDERVIHIHGSVDTLVIGEHNTINRVDPGTAREPARIIDWSERLPPAGKLLLESFKLGDPSAANFPYVLTPVQASYRQAVQALRDASTKGTEHPKRGILILGESNAGKTRLALEALKNALPDWPVLRWQPDSTVNNIPPTSFLSGMHLILLIDDLQDYVPAQMRNFDGRSLVIDSRATALRSTIEALSQGTSRIIIVTTCRTEDQLRVQAALNWLFVQLMIISVPSFNVDPEDPLTSQAITEFQKQGAIHQKEGIIHVEDWDGTLGSLVLGLSTKNSQYLTLSEQNMPAAAVLQAMKLLTLAGTIAHTERRLRFIGAEVFRERNLQNDEKTWQETVDQLTQMQFVREEIDEEGQEITLLIRKDTYFEKVITDYPLRHRPHQLKQGFAQLRKALVKLRDVDALFNLCIAYTKLKQYAPALETIDSIIAIDSTNTDAWVAKSGILSLLKRHDEALSVFDQAISLHFDPNNVHAWYNKGIILKSAGQYEEALEAIDHFLSLAPEDLNGWVARGEIFAELDRNQEALVAFNQGIELNASYGRIYAYRGFMYMKLKEYQKALVDFGRAIELNPEDDWVYDLRGFTYTKLKEYQKALVDFGRAIELNPKDGWAYVHRGVAYRVLEDDQRALVNFERAIALDPGDFWKYIQRGILYRERRDYQKAFADFEHAIELHPTYARAYVHKGIAYKELKDYQQAMINFNHAIDLRPQDARTYFYRGIVYRELGDDQKARVDFDLARILDPRLEGIMFTWDAVKKL